MKNTFKQFGFIAIVITIGFLMMACGGGDPGPHPDAERWTKFVAPESTATIDYSVDADGVCKITVGGIAMPNQSGNYQAWRASAQYKYTAKANTSYKYTFEAWTEKGSGDRPIQIEYYYSDPDYIHFYKDFTEERKTYELFGDIIPKSGDQFFSFQCAHKLGTFYVKMISITEYTPKLEYELIDDHDEEGGSNPNNGTYRVISAVGISGAVEIPGTYNDKSVTEIGEGAFFGCHITNLTIPEGVNVIGAYAFDWSGIASVIIPSSVTSINWGAFNECHNLSSITIPETVQYIGPWVFNGWTSSQKIIIKGHANRQSTIEAEWGAVGWNGGEDEDAWDEGCDANIDYQG